MQPNPNATPTAPIVDARTKFVQTPSSMFTLKQDPTIADALPGWVAPGHLGNNAQNAAALNMNPDTINPPKASSLIANLKGIMALLLVNLTLLWYLALRLTANNMSYKFLSSATTSAVKNRGDIFSSMFAGSGVDYGGLLVLMFVMLGTVSMLTSSPICGLLNPCCKLIPFYVFPGLALYFLFETSYVLFLVVGQFEVIKTTTVGLQAWQMEYPDKVAGGDPMSDRIVAPPSTAKVVMGLYFPALARLFMDMLTCLVIAILLIVMFIIALRTPQVDESGATTMGSVLGGFECASYFRMPQPKLPMPKGETSTVIVSQSKPQLQPPDAPTQASAFVAMNTAPLQPIGGPSKMSAVQPALATAIVDEKEQKSAPKSERKSLMEDRTAATMTMPTVVSAMN